MHILTSKWFIGIVGVIVGAAAILAVRFVTYQPDLTHYHANFSVYINGQRETFDGPSYYEETAAMACTLEQVDEPAERAHMHDNISTAVHVEDKLVTWGNFMQNLGWGISDTYISSRDRLYKTDDTNALTFIVNGKTVDSIQNMIINDEDRVLISYGNDNDAVLQQQYNSIPSDAHEFNVKVDPAGCSGSQPVTAQDRWNNLFK
jgi:hypothetical protein